MGRFDVRWLRFAVAAGAIAGSALVSSAVVATDESPPVDQSAPVGETSTSDPAPPDPLPTDPVGVESIVLEVPRDLPLDDINVIEMVVVEPEVTASDAIESEATEPEATEPEASPSGSMALQSSEPDAELRSAPVVAPLEQADVEEDHADGEGGSGHDDGEGGSGHDGGEGGSGHDGGEGGNVGEGTPYLMTFEVVWLEPDETPISDLDAMLPLEWRSLFELSAASVTGQGPTSATCTYPDGDDVLQCVFDNAGHGWESEGLIIPGSKEKTYTVTVAWSEDWTIDGANDDSYSARELCPRGGHDAAQEGNGSDGGHDDEGGDGHDDEGGDGHDGGQGGQGGDGGHEGERRTFPCVHTVTMRQIVVAPTEPPVVEPEPEAIAPIVPEPEAIPPVVTPAEVVEASPVAAATPRALPATGNSVSVLLVLAGLLVAAGSTLTRFTRRTS